MPRGDTDPPWSGGWSGGHEPDGSVDPLAGLRVDVAGLARRRNVQWSYNTSCVVPFVTAVADTTIVLLKVACWANDTKVTVIWSGGTGHATLLEVALGEDETFVADNLHLVVPAGENLDLDFNGGTVGRSGATTWWYTIKELVAASPAG